MRFGPSPTRCALSWVRAPRPRYFTVYTSPVNYWEASPERKKSQRRRLSRAPLEGACGAPPV